MTMVKPLDEVACSALTLTDEQLKKHEFVSTSGHDTKKLSL